LVERPILADIHAFDTRVCGDTGPSHDPSAAMSTSSKTFKATGDGWQSPMNDALRDWLKDHQLV
jgi:hypothetical protein